MMKNILFALVFVALTASLTFAQDENQNSEMAKMLEAKRGEMKKLDRLVGQWQGTGWIQMGKTRETFAGGENVQRKFDGLALLVEGNFKNKDGKVIHETIALLSPNLQKKNYDFRAFLADGNGGDYEFKAVEDGWQWGFQFPNGTVRYDIKINDNTWVETGYFSPDNGKNWINIFEMKLKKVK